MATLAGLPVDHVILSCHVITAAAGGGFLRSTRAFDGGDRSSRRGRVRLRPVALLPAFLLWEWELLPVPLLLRST